jgi:hypothetical protein
MTLGKEQSQLPGISSFRERVGNFALLLGTGILVHVFSILTAATMLLALGQPMSPVVFVVGSLGAAAFLWWGVSRYFPNARLRVFVCVILGIAVLLTGFTYLSGMLYDVSADGQSYHQEMVVQLARGWNPFRKEVTGSDGAAEAICYMVNHCTRGMETVAASVYEITPHIERCKVFNLQLIVASFCVTLCALLRLKPVRPTVAVLLSVIAALNPVSVYQSFCFYVDGHFSSVLVCLFALGVMLFRDRSPVILLSWVSAIAIAVNVKFTGIPYAGIVTGGFLIGLLIFKNLKTLLVAGAVTALAFVLGVCVLGYSPYVTNMIKKGNPFYPFSNPGMVEANQRAESPENFRGLNRLETLFISVFSKTEDACSFGPTKTSHWKWPFTVTKREYRAVTCNSVRIAGWGPLLGGAVIISAVILIMALPLTLRKTGPALGVLAIVFLSAVVTCGSWNARWFPQIWIIPIVPIVLTQYVGRRMLKFLGWSLMAVLLINIGLISTAFLDSQAQVNRLLRTQLHEMSRSSKPVVVYFDGFTPNRVRLEEMGITYREVKEQKDLPDPSHAQCIVASLTMFCYDNSP